MSGQSTVQPVSRVNQDNSSQSSLIARKEFWRKPENQQTLSSAGSRRLGPCHLSTHGEQVLSSNVVNHSFNVNASEESKEEITAETGSSSSAPAAKGSRAYRRRILREACGLASLLPCRQSNETRVGWSGEESFVVVDHILRSPAPWTAITLAEELRAGLLGRRSREEFLARNGEMTRGALVERGQCAVPVELYSAISRAVVNPFWTSSERFPKDMRHFDV